MSLKQCQKKLITEMQGGKKNEKIAQNSQEQ